MEGWSGGHGERNTVLLHGELKGARRVVQTAHRLGFVLLLKLLKVLWKSRLVLLDPRLILQSLFQLQSHGGVDVVGLHTPGVELRATLSVSTAVLRAATWEAEAVHLQHRETENIPVGTLCFLFHSFFYSFLSIHFLLWILYCYIL